MTSDCKWRVIAWIERENGTQGKQGREKGSGKKDRRYSDMVCGWKGDSIRA